MLSTPTASTRKGITSMMMRVAGTPRKDQRPMEENTEARTIETPPILREIFRSTYGSRIQAIQSDIGYRYWLSKLVK